MIFIDLGAYNGDTLRELFNWGQLFGDPKEFEIYAFEPNPNLNKSLQFVVDAYPNVQVYNWAAGVYDGTTELAVDQTATPMGSTIMPGKQAIWDTMPHITVKCFDFSKWLAPLRGEEVIVKMDVEGAEFLILEKMITDGTIDIPAKLCVEFHPNKVKNYTTDNVKDLITRCGREILLWH